MNGTGSAQRHAAAELRAGKTGDITQVPQEWHFGVSVEGSVLPVHLETDHFASGLGADRARETSYRSHSRGAVQLRTQSACNQKTAPFEMGGSVKVTVPCFHPPSSL
jgi:hypothetical protein